MNNFPLYELQRDAVALLKQLVAIPSFSKEEDHTAAVICSFLQERGIKANRCLNNVWAANVFFDEAKPTILLNSHHDTVRPNKGYTVNPFLPIEKEGKLFGLGTNDAGGALVCLIAAFMHFYNRPGMRYNLVLAASAEEEISGNNGIEILMPQLPPIDCAIVGEPTQMQMAVAERGLMVLDCVAKGQAGHAARNEGDNALYKAVKDIEVLRRLTFDKQSKLLGPVQLAVTVIETANKAHNVVPDECRFTVDVRVNELYSLEEILGIVQQNLQSEVTPRSMRLKPTAISAGHPLVKAGIAIGTSCYGSPTTSDKALMLCPALKIGPGDSARSHTADEFIYIGEIKNGIDNYIKLLNQLL